VTIEGTRRALQVHADGEPIGTTPVTFEVRPAALRLFRA
jgi:diacylglycerol kinase family enzyme